jgi:hypothetical protein
MGLLGKSAAAGGKVVKGLIDFANKANLEEYDFDVRQGYISEEVDLDNVDYSHIFKNPKLVDEDGDLNDAGIAAITEYQDRLVSLEPPALVNDMGDMESLPPSVQFKVFQKSLDDMGVEYTLPTSAGSDYVDIDGKVYRFSNHYNTSKQHAPPHYNVAPEAKEFAPLIESVLSGKGLLSAKTPTAAAGILGLGAAAQSNDTYADYSPSNIARLQSDDVGSIEAPQSMTASDIAGLMGSINKVGYDDPLLGMVASQLPSELMNKIAYNDKRGLLDYAKAYAGLIGF